MNKLVILIVIALIALPTMAQSPDGFPVATNTFDMPSDMCYSIIDQSPMIISAGNTYGGYNFSYLNTNGDMISNNWTFNGFSDHWWIQETVKAKGHVTPKCWQP